MSKYLFLILIFSFSTHFSKANTLNLLGGNDYKNHIVELDDIDHHWLAKKGVIKVGLYGSLRPPLSLVNDSDNLDGISADYLLLLKENLGVKIDIKHFSSKEMAEEAIDKLEIDLIIPPLGSTVDNNNLIQSKPILYSYPALITKKSNSMMSLHTNDDVTIATSGNYNYDNFIRKLFKNAKIKRFDSTFQALTSVDNGLIDFYVGDNIEAGYYTFFDFYYSLSLIKIWGNDSLNISFIMRKNDSELYRIINDFINSITPEVNNKIMESWVGFDNISFYSGPLELTAQEKSWINENKKVRVIINPYHFPFTMLNDNLDIRGITGDFLDLVHIKTGLDFEPIIVNSTKEIEEHVNKNSWDLHPAVIYSRERNKNALFTHPFLSTPFVIVVKEKESKSAAMKKGMTIAIPSRHILLSKFEKDYPDVKFIKVENSSWALNMLSNGEVDAAISTKLTAKYYIEHYNPGELYYHVIDNTPDAEIAFAVPLNAVELRNILNKVIDDIPKEQLAMLSNKWLDMPNIQVDTWDMYKNEFYLVIFFSILLIGSSLLWGIYLLKQIRMRKQSEYNLEEQLDFSSTVSSAIPLPLYVLTMNGELTKFNPAFSSFFLTEKFAKIGTFISDKNHPLSAIFKAMLQEIKLDLNKEKLSSYPAQINNGNEIRNVIHWFTLFKTSESKPPLLICGWQDITESKNLTDALIVESTKAKQAKQAKGIFLARMSHELRTPVSAIIGFLELIRLEIKNTDINDSNVELAYSTGQSLLNLIGDILDIEKIESGNFELHYEWTDFSALLTSTVKMFDALSLKKGLKIVQNNNINTQLFLWIDSHAMRQILVNLISNAVKFTDYGGVNITTNLITSLEDNERLLVINITDSGPGIPEIEQSKLFQPFSQTSSGKFKIGSGLGLSICHEIINFMHGRIYISKSTSQGTTFTVEIPVKVSEISTINRPCSIEYIPTKSDNNLKVLIVDDNPTNLVLICRQLEKLGYRVDEASDGRQALDKIKLKSYDLLITDINMPYVDGVELTQRIRVFDTNITIWGLTANASQQERDRCLEAGLDLLLFKPIDLQQLASLLQTVSTRKPKDELENVIDMTVFNKLSMGDHLLMCQILKHARDESKRDLLNIQNALASFDWTSAQQALHRLTGTVQILGATAIVQRCNTFKEQIQAGTEGELIQLEMDNLSLQLEPFFNAIDKFMELS